MYFSRAFLAWALGATILSLVSCAKPESVHRFAVLPFDNLSPVVSDEAWIGRAISEEVAGQLEGTRHSAVVSATAIHRISQYLGGGAQWQAAVAAGANRVVTGFYSIRSGRLSITAVVENVPGGAAKQAFSGSGSPDELLHLCEQIARNIDDEAQPPITGSARALRSYVMGNYAEAIQLDPDFGPPYVALAGAALSRHDSTAFGAVFAAARARGSGIAAVDRALLNLDDAELHATATARVDALAALVRITPADPFHLRELADAELEINRYAEAADHYRRLSGLLPSDSEPVNRMGYAYMYAGDEATATKAFQDFARLDQMSANAYDSMGDGQFFFNHFAEAERNYMASYARDPTLTEGTEPIKAAWTRLMRRDSAGATQLVDGYLGDRKKQGDNLAPFRAALVVELAGHGERARALLMPYLGSDVTAVRSAAAAQMAVFDGSDLTMIAAPLGPAVMDLVRKDYGRALPEWRRLAEESNPADWWTRSIYARVLGENGQTTESRKWGRFSAVPQPLRGVGYDPFWYPWVLRFR